MQITTHLYEQPGPVNTDTTLAAAFERAQALGIRQVVVASSKGETARKAHALMHASGIQITVVTLSHAFEHLDWCMPLETKGELRAMGMHVVTGIHALGDDVAKAFTAEHGGRSVAQIARDTLYCFSQGMKVCVEDVLMAADAGALTMDQEVISIAGTGGGADTAIVCKPAYAQQFRQLEVREILCKPRIP